MGQLFAILFPRPAGQADVSAARPGGDKKAPLLSPADQAQLELLRGRDRFTKFEKQLVQEAEMADGRMRRALASDKRDVALRFLKLRKIKERQLESVRTKLLELEGLVAAVTSEAQTLEFTQAMAQGTAALKRMQEAMPADAVRRILDDAADAQDEVAEVDRMITAFGATGEAFDEGEMEAELAAALATPGAAKAPAAAAGGKTPVVAAAGAAAAPAPAAAAAAAAAPSIDLSVLPAVPTGEISDAPGTAAAAPVGADARRQRAASVEAARVAVPA